MKEIASSVIEIKSSFAEFISSFAGQAIDEKTVPDIDVKDDSSDTAHFIFNCKDARQLIKLLPGRGFDFDEELGLITCVACNKASAPNIRVRDNKVGIFSFDISLYLSEVELEPSKQPRAFLNLKQSLVKHERESQIHLGLKEHRRKRSKKLNKVGMKRLDWTFSS